MANSTCGLNTLVMSHITNAVNLIALDESYTKHYTNLHALLFYFTSGSV